MTLHDRTRDQHHACEAHPVGRRMARGGLTAQEWADWLEAFRVLHGIVDRDLPRHMARRALLEGDLALLPDPHPSPAALRFAAELIEAPARTGAAYVLHGAHRSGGRVMAPRLAAAGLPCAHIAYADQAAAQAWVAAARADAALAPQARATFDCLLAVLDEIQIRALTTAPQRDTAA